jgi:glutamate-1-semialdehyde aminotransferase
VPRDGELSAAQRTRYDAFVRRYGARTRKSRERWEAAAPVLAAPRKREAGVLAALEAALVIARAEGALLWDLDGNSYVDVDCAAGACMLGWQAEPVAEAVVTQMATQLVPGARSALADDVAGLVSALTGDERAALLSSSEEAVLASVRIARALTGRRLVVAFQEAGHDFPGLDQADVHWLERDATALAHVERFGRELAAIVVEPVSLRTSSHDPQFLLALRRAADAAGAQLVFDASAVGFRAGAGSAQALFGAQPDMTVWGRELSGGYALGVLAGSRQSLDLLDAARFDTRPEALEARAFVHARPAHPAALAAAHAVLQVLRAEGQALSARMSAHVEAIVAALNATFVESEAPLAARRFGSMWTVSTTRDVPLAELLVYYLRDRGVYAPRSGLFYLSAAHDEQHVAAFIKAVKESLGELQGAGLMPGRPPPAPALLDPNKPPVPGARLGRDPSGAPAWFVPHPDNPKKYVKLPS